MKNYNALVLVVLLGVLFNLGCIVIFKFRLSSYLSQVENLFTTKFDEQFTKFGVDTLSRVDSFLYTNVVLSASSASSSNISASASSPFFEVIERNFPYRYFRHDGISFVDIDGEYLAVGDNFPRGGVITSISRDSICINNRYIFLNRRDTVSPVREVLEQTRTKPNDT